MATRGFVIYLLTGFSVSILLAFYLDSHGHDTFKSSIKLPSNFSVLHYPFQLESRIWPELKFSWRIVLVTVIGFLGSAFGTVGGVGGGGIFVSILNLIVGFDTKSAAAISKCMIMGASASSVFYNLRVPHPCRDVPIIDYDLAILFQPMLMLGITIGVSLSVVFPYWLITVLTIILFWGTSTRSFCKGIEMWKEETALKTPKTASFWCLGTEEQRDLEQKIRGHKFKEMRMQQESRVNSLSELIIDAEYEVLAPRVEKTSMQILCFNLRLRRLLVLILVWACFLVLQVIKNDVQVCSKWYWMIFCLQFPVALGAFSYESMNLYRESKRRRSVGEMESVCEAMIDWTPIQLVACALLGILGGTVGGLLGTGGGFILGPLLLEFGVIPQVASATATFVMLFSASLSVVEFYFLKRFPIPYALYLMMVSSMAGFWGQFFVRKLVAFLKRESIIVFILSSVIFSSALTMGVIGIESNIKMIKNQEFMGFLGFCSNQR